VFTPEESIRVQFGINSDIMICLDDFTPPDAGRKEAEKTVERTVLWAKKSKEKYDEILRMKKVPKKNRPHLYAVVQGGYFRDLRKKCAEELIRIGFDGYGYGGYVINNEGSLDLPLSRYICRLLPDDKPKFALGLGRPSDIVSLYRMGWNIFDCTLPTRDARHKRLYKFKKHYKDLRKLTHRKNFEYVYIDKKIFKNEPLPIDKNCKCRTCKNYSTAYLRHLFRIEDTLAYRLATIHNLHFYNVLMRALKKVGN
jgi:queuine tRNA-ribosyltransferase